jgi:hypothetical protein
MQQEAILVGLIEENFEESIAIPDPRMHKPTGMQRQQRRKLPRWKGRANFQPQP